MRNQRLLIIALALLALALCILPFILRGNTIERELTVTIRIPDLAQQLPKLKVGYIDVDTMIVYDDAPVSRSKGLLQWEMVYGNPVDTIFRGDSVYLAGSKSFPNEVLWTKIYYAKDTLSLEGWVIARVDDRIYLRPKAEEKKAQNDLLAPFLLYGETAGVAMVTVNNQVDLRLWGLAMVIIVLLEGMFAFRWWKIGNDKYKLVTFLVLAAVTIGAFGYAKITDLLVIFGIGK